MLSQEWIWIAIIVIAIAIEIITVGLTSVWIAIGAGCALVASLFGANTTVCLIVFFAVTFAAIFWTRPVAIKYLNARRTRTNIDEISGSRVRVIERISNDKNTGKVDYNGMEWTARATDSREYEVGRLVIARRIEGVKMMVSGEDDNAADS